MDIIEKSWKDLDFDEVDFESKGKVQWSFGRGGYPLDDHEHSISRYEEKFNEKYKGNDIEEIRYKLPQCINKMISLNKEWTKAEIQEDIRRALGIK